MDVTNELFRIGLFCGVDFGGLGGCGRDSGFVVETIEVATGLLEFLDPFLGLNECIISKDLLFNPLKQYRFNLIVGEETQMVFKKQARERIPQQSSYGNQKSPSHSLFWAARHGNESWSPRVRQR